METFFRSPYYFYQSWSDLPFRGSRAWRIHLDQVTSDANASNHVGYETFDEVIETLRRQLPDDQPIDFRSLRDFGTTNQLDYSAYFKSPQGVLGTVASV